MSNKPTKKPKTSFVKRVRVEDWLKVLKIRKEEKQKELSEIEAEIKDMEAQLTAVREYEQEKEK